MTETTRPAEVWVTMRLREVDDLRTEIRRLQDTVAEQCRLIDQAGKRDAQAIEIARATGACEVARRIADDLDQIAQEIRDAASMTEGTIEAAKSA